MTCFGMITTRNSAFYTGPALESFFRCTELGPDDRFVLIDNDGDYVLPDGFPRVELVRPAAPRGFAANVNDILRRALEMRTDAAVLNNDIVFTPGWWPPLTLRQDAVMLPMCNQQVQYTLSDRVVFRAALDWDDYAGNETALLAAADYHRVHTPPGTCRDELRVSLYCFRVPLPVLDRIGLFDESFGRGGGEDSDYILRARLAGYGVVWGGGSFVLHFAGKSTWRSGEQRTETGQREERYVERFQAKWGRDLAALFLFGEAPEAVVKRLGLAEAYAARDYRRMVADCLARRAAD